jgi:hypothetical protein
LVNAKTSLVSADGCWLFSRYRDLKRKRLERSERTPRAKLVHTDDGEQEDLKKIVKEIRELRKGATMGKVKIRELIDEGRRY